MFLGEFKPNITEGNRIALPKKLRDQIEGSEVVLAKGFEKCVFIYARSDWSKEWLKQVDNPITDLRTRELKRYVFSGACDVTLDDQGRFVLPQTLKTYAALDKELVIIGAYDHMELWDKKLWDEHIERLSKELSSQ